MRDIPTKDEVDGVERASIRIWVENKELKQQNKSLRSIIDEIIKHEMSQAKDDGSVAWSGCYALRALALLDSGSIKVTNNEGEK